MDKIASARNAEANARAYPSTFDRLESEVPILYFALSLDDPCLTTINPSATHCRNAIVALSMNFA